MKHSTERILTTHTGSLIRPPQIAEFDTARSAHQDVDEQAYAAALRSAVVDVVREQAEAGIDIVDDGEFSKSSWGTYINARVSGFQRDPSRHALINYTGR